MGERRLRGCGELGGGGETTSDLYSLAPTTERGGAVAPFFLVGAGLLHKAGRTLQSDLGLTCGGNRCVHTRLLKHIGKINIMNWDKRQVSFCSVEII